MLHGNKEVLSGIYGKTLSQMEQRGYASGGTDERHLAALFLGPGLRRRKIAGVDFILEAVFLVGAIAMRLAILLIRRRAGSTCDFETL